MSENTSTCGMAELHESALEQLKKTMPDDSVLYDLADFYKVFGDSTRVKMLWALDSGEFCVQHLAELLGMTESAISHQLKSLRQANVVRNRREGKNVYYALSDDHVKDILEKGIEHISERKE